MVAGKEEQEKLAEWDSHESVVVSLIKKWKKLKVDKILDEIRARCGYGTEMGPFRVWFRATDGIRLMYLQAMKIGWLAVSGQVETQSRKWNIGESFKEALAGIDCRPEEIEFSYLGRDVICHDHGEKEWPLAFEIRMDKNRIYCDGQDLGLFGEMDSPEDLKTRVISHWPWPKNPRLN